MMLAVSSVTSAEERIDIIGCPRPGIEVGCLVIQGQDMTTYDISSAKPQPRSNDRLIRLSGIKTKKLGICQQGIILSNIIWTYTDEPCPAR
jgi:hypothetical protein